MKEGWVQKKLGEITRKIGSGATPLGGEASYQKEGIALIRSLNVYDDGFREEGLARINGEQADRLSNVVVEKNDVLLNITGASVARSCIAPADLLPARVNQHVSIIRPEEQKLASAFLHYLLIAPDNKQRLLHAGEEGGSTRQAITKAELQEFVIEYPESLPEQQRIVDLLDEAFAGLATAKANTEKNLRNARALFESHLQSVFTQRGKGWVDSTIGEEIRFIDYRGKTPVKTADGIRLITAKNVKMGYLQETPMEFIATENYKSWMTRGIPQKGDVLFTTEAPLANVAQLDTDEKVAFAQRIIIMQPNAEKLDSTFLKYLLLSQPVQQRILTRGTGATVQGIKASLLKTIEISFPRSPVQQRELVSKLDSLNEESNRLAALYERKIAALGAMKKSLLHKAFSGAL